MALRVGQLENLSNSELQKMYKKIYIKDQANRQHLKNLNNLHQQARGRNCGHKKIP